MNEYVCTLMQSRNQTHIFHLQTSSYSQHVALQEYYEGIVDLIDSLVEAYQGKYDILTDYKMIGVLADIEEEDNVLTYIEKIARYCELKREKLPQDGFLNNIYDDIDTLLRTTQYKISRLS